MVTGPITPWLGTRKVDSGDPACSAGLAGLKAPCLFGGPCKADPFLFNASETEPFIAVDAAKPNGIELASGRRVAGFDATSGLPEDLCRRRVSVDHLDRTESTL